MCVYEEKDLGLVILDKLTGTHIYTWLQQKQIICYVCLRDYVPFN